MTASDEKKTTGGSAGDMFKGILILLLFVVGAGAGGYFFGTQQKFAPVQNVAPGTAGAIDSPSGASTASVESPAVGSLKKKYWLHTHGDDHVGYSIEVFINDKFAGKFFAPGVDKDITNLVKPGENTITFKSTLLPEGMRGKDLTSNYKLKVSVAYGDRVTDRPDENQVLLNYERNATETQSYNDPMSFSTME